MTPRRSSRNSLDALRHRVEPSWAAALMVHVVVLGAAVLPAVVFARGAGLTAGRIIHLLLLVVYVPLTFFIARALPRISTRQTASRIRIGIVGLGLVEIAVYLFFSNWIFEISAAMAAVVTVVALGYAGGPQSGDGRGAGLMPVLIVVFAATAAWMCAGSLIWWGDALEWIASSPTTATTVVLSIALCAVGLRAGSDGVEQDGALRRLDYVVIAALVVFSFRTAPLAPLKEWVSPVVPLRELSQASPTAFWIVQSVSLAIAATLMYCAVRAVGSKWAGAPLAVTATFATLFFIPRAGDDLAAIQMLPAWGPLRFVWCFILLWYIARFSFLPAEQQRTRDFVFLGTTIWLAGILWSVASAGYATAIWIAALSAFTAQRAIIWSRSQLSRAEGVRRVVLIMATPMVALAAVVVVVSAIYFALFRVMPEWSVYLSFAPLPADKLDSTGPVWYLLLLFGVLSMIAAMTLAHDATDPRLVPLAGLWTGFWAVTAFFVATNEPMRVGALVPLLLFILAIAMRLMRNDRRHRWHRVVIAALVPAFALPIAASLGHSRLQTELTRSQGHPALSVEGNSANPVLPAR